MQIIVTFGHLDESHNSIGAINTIKKAVLNVFLENENIKRFFKSYIAEPYNTFLVWNKKR